MLKILGVITYYITLLGRWMGKNYKFIYLQCMISSAKILEFTSILQFSQVDDTRTSSGVRVIGRAEAARAS